MLGVIAVLAAWDAGAIGATAKAEILPPPVAHAVATYERVTTNYGVSPSEAAWMVNHGNPRFAVENATTAQCCYSAAYVALYNALVQLRAQLFYAHVQSVLAHIRCRC
jgi:hypothetical protein